MTEPFTTKLNLRKVISSDRIFKSITSLILATLPVEVSKATGYKLSIRMVISVIKCAADWASWKISLSIMRELTRDKSYEICYGMSTFKGVDTTSESFKASWPLPRITVHGGHLREIDWLKVFPNKNYTHTGSRRLPRGWREIFGVKIRYDILGVVVSSISRCVGAM